MSRRTFSTQGGGFSLIEAAVATAIIGIAVAALMTAVAAGTRAANSGRLITVATMLAQEAREWTIKLPFSDPDPADQDNPPGTGGSDPQVYVDDLDDLMDVTFCPPRDGNGLPITDMAAWSQTLTLTWRDMVDPTSIVTNGTSDLIHIQVDIKLGPQTIFTTGWLVTRRDAQ